MRGWLRFRGGGISLLWQQFNIVKVQGIWVPVPIRVAARRQRCLPPPTGGFRVKHIQLTSKSVQLPPQAISDGSSNTILIAERPVKKAKPAL
jgi:hypothetical protein